MKYKTVLFLGVLYALSTAQTKCAAETQAKFTQARTPEYFDVKAFVEQVENGELTDDEIRENLNRQNPPRPHQGTKYYSTNTPSIQAAKSNSTQALEIFIRLGADLEKTDQYGFTPLMRAAQEKSTEAVTMLLAAGAAIDFQGMEGRSALICGAHARQLEAVQALIEAKANLNLQDHYRQTALIKAIRESYPNPEVVRVLLNAKADTGIVDRYGNTAGMYTSDRHSHPEEKAAIAALLVDAGVQLEQEIAHFKRKENLNDYKFNMLAACYGLSAPHQGHDSEPADGGAVALLGNELNLENAEVAFQLTDNRQSPKKTKTSGRAKKAPCCEIM